MRIFCTWIQKTPPWESSLCQAEEGGLVCLEAENLGILEGCWKAVGRLLVDQGRRGRKRGYCLPCQVGWLQPEFIFSLLYGSLLYGSPPLPINCQLIHEMIPLGTKQSFDRLSNLIMVFLFIWQIPGVSSRERSGAQRLQIQTLYNPANLLTWHKVNAPFNWHLVPASSHGISANITS